MRVRFFLAIALGTITSILFYEWFARLSLVSFLLTETANINRSFMLAVYCLLSLIPGLEIGLWVADTEKVYRIHKKAIKNAYYIYIWIHICILRYTKARILHNSSYLPLSGAWDNDSPYLGSLDLSFKKGDMR